MKVSDIRDRFRRTFNNQPNFMSPNVIRYGSRGDWLYELSWGEGIGGGKMFGVTVIHKRMGRDHDQSQCFSTKSEAETHIAKLVNVEPA